MNKTGIKDTRFFLKKKSVKITTIEELKNVNKNITHISLTPYFNKKIIILNNITNLTFGYNFNQKIIISQNIKHLIFSLDFR